MLNVNVPVQIGNLHFSQEHLKDKEMQKIIQVSKGNKIANIEELAQALNADAEGSNYVAVKKAKGREMTGGCQGKDEEGSWEDVAEGESEKM